MAKMTKQQAIELLKDRKVYVNGKSAEIQEKLFQLGWKWAEKQTIVLFCESPFLYIESGMRFFHSENMEIFTKHVFTEISADEILSIEVVEPLKENDIVVSGWETIAGKAVWIAVVKEADANLYTGKVVLCIESKGAGTGFDLEFDPKDRTVCDAQEWTRPATDEEKQMLIDRLKQEKSDDARKILKEVFGIEEKPECPFHPFERVLARDHNTSEWTADFFSYYDNDDDEWPYVCCGHCWRYCIPYEGNEHLIGKTDKPIENKEE